MITLFKQHSTKQRKTEDLSDMPIRKLQDYVKREIVVLQKQLRSAQQPQDSKAQQPANDGDLEIFGLMALEQMFFGFLLDTCFPSDTLSSMGGLLSGDTLSSMFSGLLMMGEMSAEGQRNLRTPFILSMYPQGRKNVQVIVDTMKAGPMRRAAQHSFMTEREARHQLSILAETQKTLDKLSRNNVSGLGFGEGQTMHQAIQQAGQMVAYKR
ncbi:MAG: hypothetical protein HND56_09775 [Pseudomonadota bacterium]|nr:hypothetical protein [Pseudomonadota bacterium]QKK05959.1 MAG: hypothetical protein HND56_09775 [Pseudomonadota bacterium]